MPAGLQRSVRNPAQTAFRRWCVPDVYKRQLYFCLKELGAEEQQAAQIESIRAARGIPAAEEAAREWNVVMQLLNEMAHLLGGQGVTLSLIHISWCRPCRESSL